MSSTQTLRTGQSRRTDGSAWAARLAQLDWLLLGAVLLLGLIGCVLVWSATVERDDLTGGDPRAFLLKQAVNLFIGCGLLAAITVTDHRWVRILAPAGYLVAVVGLALVLVMGTTVNG